MKLAEMQSIIEEAFEARRRSLHQDPGRVRKAVDSALELLDSGELRVAEKIDGSGRSTNGSRRPCSCRFGSTTCA